MATTINAIHRKRFRSGSCLDAHPLGHSDLLASRRFRRLLDSIKPKSRPAGEASAVLTRPEYFKRRSLFGTLASKVKGLFRRKAG